MRIGLDARTLYAAQRRGIGKSLLKLYQSLAFVRPDWEVVAFHRQADAEQLSPPIPNFTPRYIEMPGDRFGAWLKFRLPIAARRDGLDLLHCPANHCPRWMPVPTLVTIHDLIPLDLTAGQPLGEPKRFAASVRQAARHAAMITCPSQYTADRLAGEFSVDADRLCVTPWGGPRRYRPASANAIEETLSRHRIAPPYVIHFGAGEPRKNTRRVIESWAMLRRPLRRTWKLLILGLDAQSQQHFMELSRKLGVAQSVVLHGFAHEEDLPTLLSGAEILAYPSMSEGFGLPVLEGFAAGTAVLTSDTTSLPEVAGDAARLVSPDDPVAISRAMSRMMREPLLRADLLHRGLDRLEEFTWTACAERFAAAVERAAGQTTRRAAA